jgi:hypothetical protein
MSDVDAAYTLDHVIVFVRNLAATEHAIAQRLGLLATSHAIHPGFGTCNARIIFASEHLELLAEAEPVELRATRYGRLFLERHAAQGDGPAVYVFRTPAFDEVLAACTARGGVPGDLVIGASRSEGVTRQWEAALMPGTEPVYLHPLLPTLGRGRERPPWEPGPHPLGASRIRGVVLATGDFEAAIELYRVQLGLAPDWREEDTGAVRTAWYRLARTGQWVVLAEPRGGGHDGGLGRHVERVGDGIFGVMLDISDLQRARTELARRRTAAHEVGWLRGLVATDPEAAANLRLVLVPPDGIRPRGR